MKIVFLIHSLRKGGAEKLALELASSQEFLKSSITIVSWLKKNEYKEKKYSQVEYIYILDEKHYKWIFSLPSSSRKLKILLQGISPQAVFIFSHSVLWLAFLSGYRTIYINIIQGFGQISQKKYLKKAIYSFVDKISAKSLKFRIISPTRELSNKSLEYFGIKKSNGEVIPNGVEINKSYERSLNNKKFVISMLGTLSKHKGQHLALKPFLSILENHPSCELNIIGDGILKYELISEVKSLSLEKNVKIMGRRDDAFEIISNSNILWHLSRSEGMPLAVIEAMALGLPIVAFNVRGVRDVVENGKNGFLCDYGNLEQISSSTIQLICSSDNQKSFSNHSINLYKEKYTKNLMLQRYQNYIKNLL